MSTDNGPCCYTCKSRDVTGACAKCRHATYCNAACADVGFTEHRHDLTCAHYAAISAPFGFPAHLAEGEELNGFRDFEADRGGFVANANGPPFPKERLAELLDIIWKSGLTDAQRAKWDKKAETRNSEPDRKVVLKSGRDAFDEERPKYVTPDFRYTYPNDTLLKQIWRNLIKAERTEYIKAAKSSSPPRASPTTASPTAVPPPLVDDDDIAFFAPRSNMNRARSPAAATAKTPSIKRRLSQTRARERLPNIYRSDDDSESSVSTVVMDRDVGDSDGDGDGEPPRKYSRNDADMMKVLNRDPTVPTELVQSLVHRLPTSTVLAVASQTRRYSALVYEAMFVRDFAPSKNTPPAQKAFIHAALASARNGETGAIDYERAYNAVVDNLATSMATALAVLARKKPYASYFYIRDQTSNELLYSGITADMLETQSFFVNVDGTNMAGFYESDGTTMKPMATVVAMLEALPWQKKNRCLHSLDRGGSRGLLAHFGIAPVNTLLLRKFERDSLLSPYVSFPGVSDSSAMGHDDTTLEDELLRFSFTALSDASTARLRDRLATFLRKVIWTERFIATELVVVDLDVDILIVDDLHVSDAIEKVQRLSLATGARLTVDAAPTMSMNELTRCTRQARRLYDLYYEVV